jgi:hypothetical protein
MSKQLDPNDLQHVSKIALRQETASAVLYVEQNTMGLSP